MGATFPQDPPMFGVSQRHERNDQGGLDEVIDRLQQAYASQGWSESLWFADRQLLRRLGKHPDQYTLEDLEREVLRGSKQSTRATYVARIKSVMQTMRRLGITENRVDEALPRVRKPRAVPKPLTHEEARLLMTHAEEPMRTWFVLSCLAGLRAMEIAGLRYEDLTEVGDGQYELHIRGKGGTDLVIPAHPKVAYSIIAVGTLGRLWDIRARKLSVLACREMRRLGIHPSRARLHAGRHYFATSVLEASGWDLLTTAKLMRHANVNTTTGYTALRDDRPRQVLGMLEVA